MPNLRVTMELSKLDKEQLVQLCEVLYALLQGHSNNVIAQPPFVYDYDPNLNRNAYPTCSSLSRLSPLTTPYTTGSGYQSCNAKSVSEDAKQVEQKELV